MYHGHMMPLMSWLTSREHHGRHVVLNVMVDMSCGMSLNVL